MTRINNTHAHLAAAHTKGAQGKVRSQGKAPASAAERLARIAAKHPNADAVITAGLSKKDAQTDLDQLLSDPKKLEELQKATGVDVTPANETGEAAKNGKVVDAPKKPEDLKDVKKPDELVENKFKKSGKWHMGELWKAAKNGDLEALKTLVKILTKKVAADDYEKNLEEIRKANKKESDNSGLIVSIIMMVVAIILTCIGLAILAMILMVIVQVAMKAAKGELSSAGANVGGLAAGLVCGAICPPLAPAVCALVTVIIEQSMKAAKGEKLDGASIGGAVAGLALAAFGASGGTEAIAEGASHASKAAGEASKAAEAGAKAAEAASAAAAVGDTATAASQLNSAQQSLNQGNTFLNQAQDQLAKSEQLLKPLKENLNTLESVANEELTKFGEISSKTQQALEKTQKAFNEANAAVQKARDLVQSARQAVMQTRNGVAKAAEAVQNMQESSSPNTVAQFNEINESVDHSLKSATLGRRAAEKSAEAKKATDAVDVDRLTKEADSLLQQSRDELEQALKCAKKAEELGGAPSQKTLDQTNKYLADAQEYIDQAQGEINGGILGTKYGVTLKKMESFLGKNAFLKQDESMGGQLSEFGANATKRGIGYFTKDEEEKATGSQQVVEYLGMVSEATQGLQSLSGGLTQNANGYNYATTTADSTKIADQAKIEALYAPQIKSATNVQVQNELKETLKNEIERIASEDTKRLVEAARADILANVRESLRPYAGHGISVASWAGLVNLSNPDRNSPSLVPSALELTSRGAAGASAIVDIKRIKEEEERRESTYSLADHKASLEMQTYANLANAASAGVDGFGTLSSPVIGVVGGKPDESSTRFAFAQKASDVFAISQQASRTGNELFQKGVVAHRLHEENSSSSDYYGKRTETLFDSFQNRDQAEQLNKMLGSKAQEGIRQRIRRLNPEDKEQQRQRVEQELKHARAMEQVFVKNTQDQRDFGAQFARAERHLENQENAGLLPMSPGRQGSAQDFHSRQQNEQRSQEYVLSASQQLQIALAKDQKVIDFLTPDQRREKRGWTITT